MKRSHFPACDSAACDVRCSGFPIHQAPLASNRSALASLHVFMQRSEPMAVPCSPRPSDLEGLGESFACALAAGPWDWVWVETMRWLPTTDAAVSAFPLVAPGRLIFAPVASPVILHPKVLQWPIRLLL